MKFFLAHKKKKHNPHRASREEDKRQRRIFRQGEVPTGFIDISYRKERGKRTWHKLRNIAINKTLKKCAEEVLATGQFGSLWGCDIYVSEQGVKS